MNVLYQERRREEEARKAQEILQRRRNREEEVEVDGRYPEMSVSSLAVVVLIICMYKGIGNCAVYSTVSNRIVMRLYA